MTQDTDSTLPPFTPEQVEQIRAIAREERLDALRESNLRFLRAEAARVLRP